MSSGSYCEGLLSSDNASLHCLYFAAVLVLLLLIIMQLWKVGYFMSERFQNTQAVQGATERNVLAQNRGLGFNTGHSQPYFSSDGVKDNSIAAMKAAEQSAIQNFLVSGRGEPDFWEISSELGEYKRSLAGDPGDMGAVTDQAAAAAAQGQAQAAAAKEYLTNPLFQGFGNKMVQVENLLGGSGVMVEPFGDEVLGSLLHK